MKSICIILSMLALSACASDANIYRGGLFGQNIVGNKNYVSITNVWNEMDALPLAEQHCSKHGKSADFEKWRDIAQSLSVCDPARNAFAHLLYLASNQAD